MGLFREPNLQKIIAPRELSYVDPFDIHVGKWCVVQMKNGSLQGHIAKVGLDTIMLDEFVLGYAEIPNEKAAYNVIEKVNVTILRSEILVLRDGNRESVVQWQTSVNKLMQEEFKAQQDVGKVSEKKAVVTPGFYS